jgi:hypothetical protein
VSNDWETTTESTVSEDFRRPARGARRCDNDEDHTSTIRNVILKRWLPNIRSLRSTCLSHASARNILLECLDITPEYVNFPRRNWNSQERIFLISVREISGMRFEVFTTVTMKNAVSGILRRVAPIRTDVSEECVTSIIKVTRIGELGTTLAVTSY